MAIMITDGTGFLGSYRTRHLVREKGSAGKDVILFDRYPNQERMADVMDQVTLPYGVSEKRVWTTPNMNCENLRRDLGFEPRYTMETRLTHYLNMVRKAAGLPPVQA
jgi:nucleoside-diphosphate-sugar epimerase